jgi:FKBP-type peptidyl-prolyl cis-trans isomerase FkpA
MTHRKACRTTSAVAALLVLSSYSGSLVAQSQAALDSEESRILYALGLAVAQNLDTFNLTADELEFVQQGLADSVLAREARVTLQEYGPKIQTFAEQRASAVADTEKAEGARFLEQMAAEDGSVQTASGLVSTEIVVGSGASPAATDVVTVHYHGTFRDGSVFDSSVERGEPSSFALNQVIPCWTEGVQLMRVGGKNRLVCPSDIAYGDQGRSGIPPAAVLVFEVELLGIE